ncbi:MAG: hypothetical protein AB7J40_03310 [Candidatus Altimarinota bacterium]
MDDQSSPSGDKKVFEKALAEHQNAAIDENTQSSLNQPYSNPQTALSEDDKSFLENLIKRIEAGEINLHTPSSILNQAVYDQLPGDKKSQADLFINSTLFVIRQVYDFYHSSFDNNSDMMINMVQELRMKKEMLEKELGDVLKI